MKNRSLKKYGLLVFLSLIWIGVRGQLLLKQLEVPEDSLSEYMVITDTSSPENWLSFVRLDSVIGIGSFYETDSSFCFEMKRSDSVYCWSKYDDGAVLDSLLSLRSRFLSISDRLIVDSLRLDSLIVDQDRQWSFLESCNGEFYIIDTLSNVFLRCVDTTYGFLYLDGLDDYVLGDVVMHFPLVLDFELFESPTAQSYILDFGSSGIDGRTYVDLTNGLLRLRVSKNGSLLSWTHPIGSGRHALKIDTSYGGVLHFELNGTEFGTLSGLQFPSSSEPLIIGSRHSKTSFGEMNLYSFLLGDSRFGVVDSGMVSSDGLFLEGYGSFYTFGDTLSCDTLPMKNYGSVLGQHRVDIDSLFRYLDGFDPIVDSSSVSGCESLDSLLSDQESQWVYLRDSLLYFKIDTVSGLFLSCRDSSRTRLILDGVDDYIEGNLPIDYPFFVDFELFEESTSQSYLSQATQGNEDGGFYVDLTNGLLRVRVLKNGVLQSSTIPINKGRHILTIDSLDGGLTIKLNDVVFGSVSGIEKKDTTFPFFFGTRSNLTSFTKVGVFEIGSGNNLFRFDVELDSVTYGEVGDSLLLLNSPKWSDYAIPICDTTRLPLQTLSIENDSLVLTDYMGSVFSSVSLSGIGHQTLSITGKELSISSGNTVTLPETIQSPALIGNDLWLTGDTHPQSLAKFQQNLSVGSGNLNISGGGTGVTLDAINYWSKNSNGVYVMVYTGIGTSTPTYPLHVSGSMHLAGHFYDKNRSLGVAGQYLTRTTGGLHWQDLPDKSPSNELQSLQWDNTQNRLYISDGNSVYLGGLISGVWTENSDGTYYNGSVSIGQPGVSNDWTLQVAGNSHFGGDVYMEDDLYVDRTLHTSRISLGTTLYLENPYGEFLFTMTPSSTSLSLKDKSTDTGPSIVFSEDGQLMLQTSNSKDIRANSTIHVVNGIKDSYGSYGSSGQVLKRTSSGRSVRWETESSSLVVPSGALMNDTELNALKERVKSLEAQNKDLVRLMRQILNSL